MPFPTEAGAAPDENQDQIAPEAAPPEAPRSPFVAGRGGQPIAAEPLKIRLEEERIRTRNRLLREEYGTHDPDKVAAIKKERADAVKFASEFKAKEGERQRAEMTERDRLAADLAAAQAEREKLKAELTDLQQQTTAERQTAQLTEMAGKHVAAKFARYALVDFNRHLRSLPVEEHRRMTPRAIDRWFAKYAAENPEFAATAAEKKSKPAAPATPPPQPAPVRREGITTTRAPRGGAPRPTAPSNPSDPGLYRGKTPKPGLPNSMNRAELSAYMKERGLKGSW